MTTPKDNTPDELDEIFCTLNNSGAHACYCARSTDGGCTCALKDEYLVEAKQKLRDYIAHEIAEAIGKKPQLRCLFKHKWTYIIKDGGRSGKMFHRVCTRCGKESRGLSL